MAEEVHLALIGDLVASRESPQRAAVQAALGDELAALAFEHGSAFAAPPVQTAGDEIQALFRPTRARRIVPFLRRLTDRLYGGRAPGAPPSDDRAAGLLQQRIVFGLGCGALSTGPLPTDGRRVNVALLDGPCFHRARAALDEARRHGRWVVARGFDRELPDAFGLPRQLDAVLSLQAELLGALRAGWTPLQAHDAAAVARELQAGGRGAQKRVAEAEGVSPSVISESLKASRAELVRRGEELLADLLENAASLALAHPESA